MRQLETSGLGGVGAAPAASQQNSSLAAEAFQIAQGACEFQDDIHAQLARVLALRHGILLSHARVIATELRP
jgi:hypothetical protein